LFEPCGLPQMIAPIYGSLPVARDTGGIHDTVMHLDADNDIGNGFLFKTYDSGGLFWAISQAMAFYKGPIDQREKQIQRIMAHAAKTFNHDVTAKRYIELYEKMLDRPLTHDGGTEKSRDKRQKAEDRRLKTEDRRQETGD